MSAVVLPERARRFIALDELKRSHYDLLRARGEELNRLRAQRHEVATELAAAERKRARILAKLEAIDRQIEELDRR